LLEAIVKIKMALKRNMNQAEMIHFIDNELFPQIKKEIKNWIYPKKQTGGYFVVTRQIFCIADFLRAVYTGYSLSERKKDKKGRKIATSDKTIEFITKFFEPKKTYERDIVTKLYYMYRHGLVHLYQPKILKLSTRKRLSWFFYRGKRHIDKIKIGTDGGERVFKNINHLQVLFDKNNKNHSYLVISIDCLYGDFEEAISRYRNKLATTKYLQRNWRTAVNAMCKPR